MLWIEYLFNVALTVAVVSLLTMMIIVILGLTVPNLLVWILGGSTLFAAGSFYYTRKNKRNYYL